MVNFKSPKEVWENFNNEETLDVKKIREYTENNVQYSHIYFTSRKCEKGAVRVFAIYAKNLESEYAPVVLIVPHKTQPADRQWLNYWTDRGYSAMIFDYSGKNGTFSTIYPDELQYAIPESKKPATGKTDDAHKSFWYEWTYAARRAVTYIRTQTHSVIGLFGIGSGADIVWLMSAVEERCSAAVTLFGAGWIEYEGYFKFDETKTLPPFDASTQLYTMTLAPQSYAPFTRCPILYMSGSNSSMTPIERACDTLKRVPETVEERCSFSANLNNLISPNAANTPKAWFDSYLKGMGVIPSEPECEIVKEEGSLNAKIKVDPSIIIESVELYVSENEINPKFRVWKKIDCLKVDSDYYYATLPFSRSDSNILLFVNVNYVTGCSYSSPLVQEKLSKYENLIPTEPAFTRSIYSYKDNIDSVFHVSGKAFFGPSIFLKSDLISKKTGPIGIEGVYLKEGLFSTAKISSKEVLRNEDSSLQFDVYSSKKQNISVIVDVLFGVNTVKYYATVSIVGGEFWQRIKLIKNDFKNQDNITLKEWANVKEIYFETGGHSFMINNFVWI